MFTRTHTMTRLLGCSALIATSALAQTAVGTEFTYQGTLRQGGVVVNDSLDLRFILFDAAAGGTQIGVVEFDSVAIVDGQFTVEIDFGAGAFDGDARWLAIGVRAGTDVGADPYTGLPPRQPMTPAPYAQTAVEALGVAGLDGHSLDAVDGTPADAVFVQNNGHVGIGTTVPVEELHLAFDGNGPAIRVENLKAGGGTAGLILADEDQEWEVRNTSTNLQFRDRTLNVPRMTITPTGDVGIGTQTPSTRLDVNGTVTATSFAGDGSSLSGIHSLDAADGNPTDAVFVSNSGNVGINTTSPAHNLHVVGGSPEVEIEATSSGASGLRFKNTDREYSIRMTNNEKFVLRDLTANNTDRLTIIPTGEVGIGTANPPVKFSVADGGNPVGIRQGHLGSSAMELSTTDGAGNQATRLFLGGQADQPDYAFYAGAFNSEWDMVRIYDQANGARMDLKNDAGVSTIVMKSAETAGTGAEIVLRDAAGVGRITLDADRFGVGRITTDELEISGGADIAEPFDVAGDVVVEPGMVVSIDPRNPGQMRLTTGAYDRTVAGIISGAGGVKPGLTLKQRGTIADGKHPVALTGRVWCKGDADAGAIVPGDLLTTSDIPGHAMKVSDHGAAQGAIIGKAMTALENGQGLVLVLVSLQ